MVMVFLQPSESFLRQGVQKPIEFHYGGGGATNCVEPIFRDGQSSNKVGSTKTGFFEYVLNFL